MIGLSAKEIIPVIDCPICGAKDVPLSCDSILSKEGESDIVVWSCSACGKVPNLAEDVKVKRCLSPEDMEKMGYALCRRGR